MLSICTVVASAVQTFTSQVDLDMIASKSGSLRVYAVPSMPTDLLSLRRSGNDMVDAIEQMVLPISVELVATLRDESAMACLGANLASFADNRSLSSLYVQREFTTSENCFLCSAEMPLADTMGRVRWGNGVVALVREARPPAFANIAGMVGGATRCVVRPAGP